MIAFQMAQDIRPDISKTGVRYKEKLAERRKKAAGKAPPSPPAAVQVEPPSPPKMEEPAAQVKEPPAPPKVEEPVITPKTPEPVAQVELPRSPPPVQATQPPAPPSAPAAPQQFSPSITAASGPDEIRTTIRTLMGLILKHRGGPGFGAGGLKGAEIEQYEQLMQEATALLKEEAQSQQAPTPQAPAVTTPAAPEVATATPDVELRGLATVPSSPSGPAQVESMLACIDGAVLMYRNSPPELKESVLMTVRAALLSAVNTCNKVLGENEGIPSTVGAGSSVDSMLACVEGAIQMYRNSPAEIQQAVLLTLRAAFLSAIGTCNKIIAENEVQNFHDYKDATAGLEIPAPTPKPVQFYDVAEVTEEPQIEQTTAMGTDSNSVVLENIYNKMQAAAGNGKLGLREDLTADEAADLADSVAELRTIMMEELENGIPVADSSTTESSSSGSVSTTSLYQKMLDKARAEKAGQA